MHSLRVCPCRTPKQPIFGVCQRARPVQLPVVDEGEHAGSMQVVPTDLSDKLCTICSKVMKFYLAVYEIYPFTLQNEVPITIAFRDPNSLHEQ